MTILNKREKWRIIPSSTGRYEVSSLGRIRNYKTKRIRKQFLGEWGYMFVGKVHSSSTFVHKLVAEAFIGLCPTDKETNHKDLNKVNNYYRNLEYVTHSGNVKHAYANGANTQVGSVNGNAKLNEREVIHIRNKYAHRIISLVSFKKKYAKKYDVPESTIDSVVHNKRCWKGLGIQSTSSKRIRVA